MNRGGVVNVVSAPGLPQRPWFVERAYPGANAWKGAALNGFMVTVLNLDATAPLLNSRPNRRTTGPRADRSRQRAPGARLAGALAERLAREGERSLQRYLPLHDTGKWSLYGLLTPGYMWRTHVADTGYHCYHVPAAAAAPGPGPGLRVRGVGAQVGRLRRPPAASRAQERALPGRAPSRGPGQPSEMKHRKLGPGPVAGALRRARRRLAAAVGWPA